MKKALKCFNLRGVGIFEQLLFEEALLRTSKENCFVFNYGSMGTKIVMGFSGKADELINIPLAKQDKVEVIRRYTGGGTVVVDHSTIFTTFIMNVCIRTFALFSVITTTSN